MVWLSSVQQRRDALQHAGRRSAGAASPLSTTPHLHTDCDVELCAGLEDLATLQYVQSMFGTLSALLALLMGCNSWSIVLKLCNKPELMFLHLFACGQFDHPSDAMYDSRTREMRVRQRAATGAPCQAFPACRLRHRRSTRDPIGCVSVLEAAMQGLLALNLPAVLGLSTRIPVLMGLQGNYMCPPQ